MPFLRLPSLRKKKFSDPATTKKRFKLKKGQEESFTNKDGNFLWDYDIGKYRKVPTATAPTVACCTNKTSVMCCSACSTSSSKQPSQLTSTNPFIPPYPSLPPPSYHTSDTDSDNQQHPSVYGGGRKRKQKKDNSYTQSTLKTETNMPKTERAIRAENRALRQTQSDILQIIDRTGPTKQLTDSLHINGQKLQDSNDQIAQLEEKAVHFKSSDKLHTSSLYEQRLPAAQPGTRNYGNPYHVLDGFNPKQEAARKHQWDVGAFGAAMRNPHYPPSHQSSDPSSIDFNKLPAQSLKNPIHISSDNDLSPPMLQTGQNNLVDTINNAQQDISSAASTIKDIVEKMIIKVQDNVEMLSMTEQILRSKTTTRENDTATLKQVNLAMTMAAKDTSQDIHKLADLAVDLTNIDTSLQLAQTGASNTEYEQLAILRQRCEEEKNNCLKELTKCRTQLAHCKSVNQKLTNNVQTLTEAIEEMHLLPQNASALALSNCIHNNQRLNKKKDQLLLQIQNQQQQLRLATTTPRDEQNIRQLSEALQQSAALHQSPPKSGYPIPKPFTSTPKSPFATGIEALKKLSQSDTISLTTASPVIPKPPPADPVTQPVRYLHEQTINNLKIAEDPEVVNPKQFIYNDKSITKFDGTKGFNKWIQAFEQTCQLGGFTAKTKARLMYQHMEGSAKLALDSLIVRDPSAIDDPVKLSLELMRVFKGQAQMAQMHADLGNLKQSKTVADYNLAYANIVTEMGGIQVPGQPNTGNQIGVMQAISSYKKGLKPEIQRALIAQEFVNLQDLQQAAIRVEHDLTALGVNLNKNSTSADDGQPITCSRCGSSKHRRATCAAKVHCDHCVGEGHNTKVCFKKFPHMKDHFNKSTNSAISNPKSPTTRLAPQTNQQKRVATAFMNQLQQHQVVTNTSSRPIPAAPSQEYCHYHNTWTHADTNCSLQRQTHQNQAASASPNTQKPKVPLAQIECYNCHKKGHYRNNCPQTIQSVGCLHLDQAIRHKPTVCVNVSNWFNIQSQDPAKEWKELEVIIDTGSDINLVDSFVVQEMGLTDQIQAVDTPVTQLNGDDLLITGKVLLPVSLGEPSKLTTQQWFEVNNYGLNILGTPFLTTTQSVPDLSNQQFFMNNYQKSIPLHIKASKNDEVPDQDQINSVNINNQQSLTEQYPCSNGLSHHSSNYTSTLTPKSNKLPNTTENKTVNLLNAPKVIAKPDNQQLHLLQSIEQSATQYCPIGVSLLKKEGDGYNFDALPGLWHNNSVRLEPVETASNENRAGLGHQPQKCSSTKPAKTNYKRLGKQLTFNLNDEGTLICTKEAPLIEFKQSELDETPTVQPSKLTVEDVVINNTDPDVELTQAQSSVMAATIKTTKDYKLRHKKNVPKIHQDRLDRIIAEYLAAIDTNQPSKLKPVHIKVKPDAEPIVERKRRHTLENTKIIKDEVDKLYHKGIIRRSISNWSSELVVAPKPGTTKKRVCVDFSKLNEVTEPNLYGTSTIEHLVSKFNNYKIASKIDLSSAFQQIQLTADSIKNTAFRAEGSLWEYVTMPYGLMNAPGDFQIRIDDVFHEELQEWLINYLDDFCVPSVDYTDHLDKLEHLFKKLADYNIIVQPEKCDFFVERFNFLGHYITPEGIEPQANYIAKALSFTKPTTKQQVQSWLGVINWIDEFIPGCRARVSKIQPLIHGKEADDPVDWTPEADAQFQDILEELDNELKLVHFQTDRPAHIIADASSTSVGGVLVQEQGPVNELKGMHITEDGREEPPKNVKVVRWCSKTLSKSQQNWPISTRELYAQLIALKKFSLWTSGGITYNWTDHKGLTQRLSPDKMTNRDSIKVQACMSYNTTFKYLPGCTDQSNIIALPDAISRLCTSLAKDPPNEDPELPPVNPEPAHTLPKTTSYFNMELPDNPWFRELMTLDLSSNPKPKQLSNQNSSDMADIEANPGPNNLLMRILIILFGDGKTKKQKSYHRLPLLLLYLTTIQCTLTTEKCSPTISGKYQIISAHTQLYQDFSIIEYQYRQEGYHLCYWDATLITNTANCTIEGKHINISNNINAINSSNYVVTAIKNKEIIIFSKDNETTTSLQGLKIVSRVVRIPVLPILPILPILPFIDTEVTKLEKLKQHLKPNLKIYSYTDKKEWNLQCLRFNQKWTKELLASAIDKWCQKTPPLTEQDNKYNNQREFACPLNHYHSYDWYSKPKRERGVKVGKQWHFYSQSSWPHWTVILKCMNKAQAESNTFPPLKIPVVPCSKAGTKNSYLNCSYTPLECIWSGAGEPWNTTAYRDTGYWPTPQGLTYANLNEIFDDYINPPENTAGLA